MVAEESKLPAPKIDTPPDVLQLYVWGIQSEGQLADRMGNDTGAASPVLIGKLSGKSAPISASAGAGHVVAVAKSGDVFAWGRQSNGQCGRKVMSKPYKTAAYIPSFHGKLGAVKVACGANHTLVLTKDGLVFSFGKNADGQLGVGVMPGETPSPAGIGTPRQAKISGVSAIAAGGDASAFLVGTEMKWCGKIPSAKAGAIEKWCNSPVKAMACGPDAIACVTTSGSVETAGDGPLKRGGPLSSLSNIKDVALGKSFAVCLTADGKVLTIGTGVGAGMEDKQVKAKPSALPGIDGKVVQISAGMSHAFAITDSGVMYSWGMNHDGQLGLGKFVDALKVPTVVRPPKDSSSMAFWFATGGCGSTGVGLAIKGKAVAGESKFQQEVFATSQDIVDHGTKADVAKDKEAKDLIDAMNAMTGGQTGDMATGAAGVGGTGNMVAISAMTMAPGAPGSATDANMFEAAMAGGGEFELAMSGGAPPPPGPPGPPPPPPPP